MECERKNKWWRGCKFEARFDSELPKNLSKATNMSSYGFEAIKTKTYVCDVCVRCGETVHRKDESTNI